MGLNVGLRIRQVISSQRARLDSGDPWDVVKPRLRVWTSGKWELENTRPKPYEECFIVDDLRDRTSAGKPLRLFGVVVDRVSRPVLSAVIAERGIPTSTAGTLFPVLKPMRPVSRLMTSTVAGW